MQTTIEERIVTLLQLCSFPNSEKEYWENALDVLTDPEKEKLEATLLRQLDFEFEKGRKIGEKFVNIVQNHQIS